MENVTQKEGMGTAFVNSFCDKILNGSSVLLQPSKEPNYAVNATKGFSYTGFNAIVTCQGLKDAGIESRLVISDIEMQNMKDEKGYSSPIYAVKGTKAIGTVITENKDARYHKDDEEVKNGEHKAGELKTKQNGEPYNDLNYYHMYSVKNCVHTEKSKNLKYESNVYSSTEKYSKDKEIEVKRAGGTTEKIQVKAGDPVIIHHAGTPITVSNGKSLDEYKEPERKPLFVNNQVPLYIRKDNSAKEVLMENLTKFFRGNANGNFEGCKFTKEEVENIRKEFAEHSRAFMGICKTALARAIGDEETVKRIDEAVAKKTQVQEKENININTNSKGKGRA